MGIRERLLEHPSAFFSGCFVWIFLAIWIYSLIVWTIQGDIDFLVGLVGCAIALALGYITMNPPRQDFAPWIGIATAAPVICFPFVSRALQRRAIVQIDIEDVERAYSALGQQPENPALKFRLAKALYNRGLVEAAIAIAEPALQRLPRQHYMDEYRMVQGWRTHAEVRAPRTFACLNCGNQNAPGVVFCQGCGGRLFLPHAEGKWVGKSTAQRVLVAWFGLILLAVGIPAATMTLIPVAALITIFLLAGLAVCSVVLALRPADASP